MTVRTISPEFLDRIHLLNLLLTDIGTSVDAILDTYPLTAFYRRLLTLDPGWSEADENTLTELAYGTRHHRNARSLRQYVADLLLGWLLQDGILHLLRRQGIQAEPSGSDADRLLKRGAYVTEQPDICVTYATKRLWIDVVADYPTKRNKPSFWKETKRCHLRDNKFLRLVEYAKTDRSGIIGVIVKEREYFWLEVTAALANEIVNPPPRNRKIRRLETHWPYGGKPAIELNLRILEVEFLPLTTFPKGLPL